MEGFIVVDFPIFVLFMTIIIIVIGTLVWELYKSQKNSKFWQERYNLIKRKLSLTQDTYYKIKFTVPNTEKENENAKN